MNKKKKETDNAYMSEKVRSYIEKTYNIAIEAMKKEDLTLLEDIIGYLGFLLDDCNEY